jgi:rhamnose utilization protein RhaD (predicted bifunctional aldolase and dehydrogenase)
MPEPEQLREELIAMSRKLGDPAADCAILAEGNTSARIDEESFWVKASGAELPTISAEGFVRVRFAPVLSLLDAEDTTDEAIKRVLLEACMHNEAQQRPSIEALMHALLLQEPGVHFIGHTHPVAVNAIVCSQRAEEAISGRVFPDEVVCCGLGPAWVPYTDPGVPLARRVVESVREYAERHGERPRAIWMQNHGLIALGSSAREVENVTAMSVKTARIILGTYALGGPNFLADAHVHRVHTRPDDLYRREKLGLG